MYFKMKLVNDNMLEVLDYVEDKKDDEYIYATKEELNKINTRILNTDKIVTNF